MIKVILKKRFRKMIRKMQADKRKATMSEILGTQMVDDQIAYLNGIDDGYYCALEDILKWIEKKKK